MGDRYFMKEKDLNTCFVIMPFGIKPINDPNGGTYDFDKVYRIVIKRAIREAGMDPIRADEQKGSSIIHFDMFRDLRDRSVVLADLSLYNPNVFYELGIRHVLSSAGTVLMCCRGNSDLPFDVKLSRVIFYNYDGISFDWEEVERVIQELREALKEAKKGVPDSPVHALLDPVFPYQKSKTDLNLFDSRKEDRQSYESFHRIVAQYWLDNGESLPELNKQFGKSIFGIRALGYLCLEANNDPKQAIQVARASYYAEQNDITIKIYQKLEKNGIQLGIKDLLTFGSAISEEQQDLKHADLGLKKQEQALELVKPMLKTDNPDLKTLEDATGCYHSLAGIYRWKWELARENEDLLSSIEFYKKALDYGHKALEIGSKYAIGSIANLHLKLMLLLRIKDEDVDRPDHENHREAILKLEPAVQQKDENVSYLRWYKAITYADLGDEENSKKWALTAFTKDSIIINKPEITSVGRKQYTRIRRFIEQFFNVLRNPNYIGYISQILQFPLNLR